MKDYTACKNILAIDTSSMYLSLALRVDNKIYTYIDKVDNKQSESIIPQIQFLLGDAGITVDKLDYIAYNQGPGSFTGLRIGLSVALGVAFGSKALLIPIPAFMLYALQAYDHSGCSQVLVGLDARLKQLYFAGVDAVSLEYFISPQLLNPESIELRSDTVMIGNGFIEYRDLLINYGGNFDTITAPYPDATYLLKLATSGKFEAVTPLHADLLYLRNKVAFDLKEQYANKNSQTS